MPNLFDEAIYDKYDSAKYDKENSTFKEKIISSLDDAVLQDEWLQLKSQKKNIKDESDYKNFIGSLQEFFNKVCGKITAPGVDAFINWIQGLGIKIQNLNDLRDYLINNYQHPQVSEQIEFIQSNGAVIDYDINKPKIFNELLKSANKEIKDKVKKVLEKPELYDTTVPEFLKDIADELDVISEIEQLSYSLLGELFSDEDKRLGIEYYDDVVSDAISYIQQPQTKYPTTKGADISTIIRDKINDLTTLIDSLSDFGIAKNGDEKLKAIYQKSKTLIVGKEGTLKESWVEFEKTWEELENYYTTIKDFFKTKGEISIDILKAGKAKWNISSINTDLKHLIDKYIETVEKNPLETLANYSTPKGIRDELLKKAKSIEEVKGLASNLSIKLFTLLDEKANDYAENKMQIIDSIVGKKSNLNIKVKTIKECISALKKANTSDYKDKNVLVFLSTDFDLFYDYYNSIDTVYTQLLSEAGMKENIEWLQQITNGAESLELTDLHLNDVEKLKELIKFNLIKLSLIRNN